MEPAGIMRCIDFDRVIEGVDERGFTERYLLTAGSMRDFDFDDRILRVMIRRGDNKGMARSEVTRELIVKDGRACCGESLREGESVSGLEEADLVIREPTVLDDGVRVVEEEHMVESLLVEGKYGEEDVVNGITNGFEMGDFRMDVNGDVEVGEGVDCGEHKSVSGTSFEENTDVVEMEIVVEERVIGHLIDYEMVDSQWDNTEGVMSIDSIVESRRDNISI